MTISVSWACGKEYRLGADQAERRFDCRECGTEVRVPRPELETARMPDLAGADDIEKASPVHFVPTTKSRSKRKRSRSENDSGDEGPSSSWVPGHPTSPLCYLALLDAPISVPFILLRLLDYFDVFKLHGGRRSARTQPAD